MLVLILLLDASLTGLRATERMGVLWRLQSRPQQDAKLNSWWHRAQHKIDPNELRHECGCWAGNLQLLLQRNEVQRGCNSGCQCQQSANPEQPSPRSNAATARDEQRQQGTGDTNQCCNWHKMKGVGCLVLRYVAGPRAPNRSTGETKCKKRERGSVHQKLLVNKGTLKQQHV